MPASLHSDGVRDYPVMLFGFHPEHAFSFAAISADEQSSEHGWAGRKRWILIRFLALETNAGDSVSPPKLCFEATRSPGGPRRSIRRLKP
jgi:hypothetical protein